MNRNEEQRQQDLVESLLHSLYENDKNETLSLVSAGMQRIDETSPVDLPPPRSASPSHARHRHWWTIATVAAILTSVLIGLQWFESPRSATAAVTRSLEQAIQDIGRHYRVSLEIRMPDQSLQNYDADLYVKGGKRFAIRVFGPVQQARPFWLGANPDRSWVVPPVGPILEGEQRHLNQWAAKREDIATPYLHISTALELMRDNYELKSLPREDLKLHQQTVNCDHVSGTLKGNSNQQNPHQFELWADAKTGVALKVVAYWNLADDEFGRQSVMIQFQNEESLDDNFFTPQAHGGTSRSRIKFSEESQ
ncbi:MAG: hypothetical protein AAFN77_20990 [Planctomycetota bacterium]